MFSQLRDYFIAVSRTIIWAVALVALLFVAFCAVRLLGVAFDWVDAHLPSVIDGDDLLIAAAVIVASGILKQLLSAIIGRKRKGPPSSGASLTSWKGPPQP